MPLFTSAQVFAKPRFQHNTNEVKIPSGNITISMFIASIHCVCVLFRSVHLFFSCSMSSHVLWILPPWFSLVICPSISQSLILFLCCYLFPAWISSLLRLIFIALFWNGSGGSIQAVCQLRTPYLCSRRCFTAQTNQNLSTRRKTGLQEAGEWINY